MKDRIKLKAHDLFMQYGVRSVTMDEIALQMGVSKKTIYQYYADKDELVDAVMVDLIDTNQNCCDSDREKAKNAVHEVFLAIEMMQEMFANMNPSILFELEKYYPKSFEKFSNHKYNYLGKILNENLQRGITEQLYRAEIDIDVLVKVRLESMMMPFNHLIFPHNKYKFIEVETELTTHFLFGLATIKGHKLITKYQNNSTKNTNTNEKNLA